MSDSRVVLRGHEGVPLGERVLVVEGAGELERVLHFVVLGAVENAEGRRTDRGDLLVSGKAAVVAEVVHAGLQGHVVIRRRGVVPVKVDENGDGGAGLVKLGDALNLVLRLGEMRVIRIDKSAGDGAGDGLRVLQRKRRQISWTSGQCIQHVEDVLRLMAAGEE